MLAAALLRELAGKPQVAAAQTLREVRADDRASLGWHCGLLPAGEQGLARLRRGAQQQDPGDPAPRLRPAHRRQTSRDCIAVDMMDNASALPTCPQRQQK